MQSKHKQSNCKHSRRKLYGLHIFLSRDQRIIDEDDIEFVTEFPCLLGHPVYDLLVGFTSL